MRESFIVTSKNENSWRFRREITFGTLLQVVALLLLMIAAWINLQKELAIIRHDLDTLVANSHVLQEHIEYLNHSCQEYEFRLSVLEQRYGLKTTMPSNGSENATKQGWFTF